MFKHNAHKESGNAAIAALAAVVIIAAGIAAYMLVKDHGKDASGTQVAAVETASGAPTDTSAPPKTDNAAPADQASASPDASTVPATTDQAVKPGNPVVATVDGQPVTRADVFNYIQNLPPQARQVPVQQLFPVVLDQVVNAKVIDEKTTGVKLDGDPEVEKQLAIAKDNIVRTLYVQRMVEKKMTEDRIKKAYDEYKAAFPAVDEISASHILVKDEDKAKDLIKQLDGGADFAKLAQENSIDGTAKSGGKVGWFAKNDVVKDFADAAFATPVGTYTKTPVKTEFGWHVIKVEDKRKRPVPEYDQAKPFIEAQLRRAILEEIIKEWRDGAKVEKFDINGDPVKKAG